MQQRDFNVYYEYSQLLLEEEKNNKQIKSQIQLLTAEMKLDDYKQKVLLNNYNYQFKQLERSNKKIQMYTTHIDNLRPQIIEYQKCFPDMPIIVNPNDLSLFIDVRAYFERSPAYYYPHIRFNVDSETISFSEFSE